MAPSLPVHIPACSTNIYRVRTAPQLATIEAVFSGKIRRYLAPTKADSIDLSGVAISWGNLNYSADSVESSATEPIVDLFERPSPGQLPKLAIQFKAVVTFHDIDLSDLFEFWRQLELVANSFRISPIGREDIAIRIAKQSDDPTRATEMITGLITQLSGYINPAKPSLRKPAPIANPEYQVPKIRVASR